MSQAQTEVSGLRMLFEGVPDSLISSIDLLESRMDALEKKSVASADKSEKAVKRYYRSWIDGAQDAEDISLAAMAGIQKQVEGIKAPMKDAEIAAISAGAATKLSFNSAGEAIDQSTSGIRRFSGALSGAVGAVTGVIAVVTTLIGVLAILGKGWVKSKEDTEEANKAYQDIRDSILSVYRAVNSGEVVSNDQIEAMEKLVYEAEDLSIHQRNRIFDLMEESKQLNRILRTQQEYTEAVKQTSQEYFSISDQIKAINIEINGDAAEAEDERHKQRLRAIDREWQESSKTNGAAYDALIAAEKSLHEFKMNNIKEEAHLKHQADIEAASRAQIAHQNELDRIKEREQKTIESNNKIVSNAASSLDRAFGDETTRLLNGISKKIDKAGRRASRSS